MGFLVQYPSQSLRLESRLMLGIEDKSLVIVLGLGRRLGKHAVAATGKGDQREMKDMSKVIDPHESSSDGLQSAVDLRKEIG